MFDQNGFTRQPGIVQGGLRRPNWVCQNTRQIAVLVRDASGSMRGQAASDATAASQDLVNELAQPANKDGFEVAVVDFSDDAKVVNVLEKATALDGRVPAITIKASTNITDGLQRAAEIVQAAESAGANQEGVHYLRPVVICFTDGAHNVGPHPRDVANDLKQKADLVTIAFGPHADEGLMREIASSPQHFYRCRNGRELRAFLAAVGATLTGTMAAGADATKRLAALQQQ